MLARPFTHPAVFSAAVLLLVALGVAVRVGSPYPGFFYGVDYRVSPFEPAARAAGLTWGDRIVAVDGGGSPITLDARIAASQAPVRYELERGGRRFTATLAPAPLTWTHVGRHLLGYFVVSALMLAVGIAVHAQNPAAWPNRAFLAYMCLWAVSNVTLANAQLGIENLSTLAVAGISTLLSVHGWIFFLTYPVNPSREEWLRRRGVIRALYACALALGAVSVLTLGAVWTLAPQMLLRGPLYPLASGIFLALAVLSFPIKIWALLDTRRRAASPLVNQQTKVLILGIGLGLGGWLLFMLAPLTHLYPPPFDPQWGSALVLLYPAVIAYATVRYRLFDVTLIIRRSLAYTALAVLVAGAYALALAGANALLATADLARSPWFSGMFMFVVALLFLPVRAGVQRAVDRTFFRERYDHAAAIQALARSMTSLLDLDEIGRRVTETIESVMHARGVRLVVGAPPVALVSVLAQSAGALSSYQLAADPRFAAIEPTALDAYRDLGAEVVVPLRFREEVRGLLTLGPKRAEAPYTAEDLALLETLADQTAVAVANAVAHRQVVEYAGELERSLLIRSTLAKFVPERVRQLVDASPEGAALDKRETDVSVFFADVTGYTRLSARLAGDTLSHLVERYFGAFLDEIVRRGGDVSETAGDGLMVFFHEGNHARDAVETARAIHRTTAELNAALADDAESVAMHIGINTGSALLGATKIEGRAGARWTYTASGLTTNVAARLAALADAGEIVISEATRTRLGESVAAEELGLRELKGVETPVRVYRLT